MLQTHAGCVLTFLPEGCAISSSKKKTRWSLCTATRTQQDKLSTEASDPCVQGGRMNTAKLLLQRSRHKSWLANSSSSCCCSPAPCGAAIQRSICFLLPPPGAMAGPGAAGAAQQTWPCPRGSEVISRAEKSPPSMTHYSNDCSAVRKFDLSRLNFWYGLLVHASSSIACPAASAATTSVGAAEMVGAGIFC